MVSGARTKMPCCSPALGGHSGTCSVIQANPWGSGAQAALVPPTSIQDPLPGP